MPTNDALWTLFEDFDLDDPKAQLNFTRRLARENGWTPEFAKRVIGEYKRFCYLACVAGHEVTPSDEVDQAWHLHLVYSHSYWDEFCPKVLGRPFHHGPTKGGPTERKRYDENYIATVNSYQREFGSWPPADIWPEPDIRFGESLMAYRINTARNWVIPKPNDLGSKVVFGLALAGAALALNWLLETAFALVNGYRNLVLHAQSMSPFLAVFVIALSAAVVIIGAVVSVRVIRSYKIKQAEQKRKQRHDDKGGGCSTAGGGCGGDGGGAGGCGGGCGGGGCGG